MSVLGTPLSIILEGDGAFKDIENLEAGHLDSVALLDKGTDGGRPSVAFLIKSSSGQHVMGQTTLRLLKTAVSALCTRAEMNNPNWDEGD